MGKVAPYETLGVSWQIIVTDFIVMKTTRCAKYFKKYGHTLDKIWLWLLLCFKETVNHQSGLIQIFILGVPKSLFITFLTPQT